MLLHVMHEQLQLLSCCRTDSILLSPHPSPPPLYFCTMHGSSTSCILRLTSAGGPQGKGLAATACMLPESPRCAQEGSCEQLQALCLIGLVLGQQRDVKR